MKALIRTLLLILFVCGSKANAGIRPSFGLDYCSWHATHIVVATEGERIDGRLTVLESWKGDLSPGEVISISELATFKSPSSRAIKAMFDRETKGPLKIVTGSRMILFLKKESEPVGNRRETYHDAASKFGWAPADKAGINVSVVWVEADQTFAFLQLMNPGPSLLTNYGETESEIRDRSFAVIRVQDSLNETLATSDCSKKTEALEEFSTSSLYYASEVAFAEMQKCGDAALGVLRRMLNDQSLLRVHRKVIESMADIGGEKVGDELTQIVKEELEFWKATGPGLKEGWWNEIDQPETDALRNRYGRVYAALYSLRKLGFSGCKESIIEFRDFWRSLPQLEDKSGLNQISEECDKILNSLNREN